MSAIAVPDAAGTEFDQDRLLSSECAIRFASLGSGSKGNALLVSSACVDERGRFNVSPALPGDTPPHAEKQPTTLLLDSGFAIRETVRRMAALHVVPRDITAVLVTHEHRDHMSGALAFARKYAIPVWMSHGTAAAAGTDLDGLKVHLCTDGKPVSIGDFQVHPYTVPHDAREPLQYVFQRGLSRLGVLTDAGKLTQHLVNCLSGCHGLVLECNHDADMLARSDYPASLKRRIGGDFGHLSNHVAARILDALDQSLLQAIMAAHLSEQNNNPESVLAALLPAIHDRTRTRFDIATQSSGFGWQSVGSLN